MEGKTVVNHKVVPDLVKFKNDLKSSSEFLTDTKLVSIIPTSGGTFGSDQRDCVINIQDPNVASMLHLDSCYITGQVQVLKNGAATPDADDSAMFEVSANSLIETMRVRALKSRVILSECRNFHVMSAIKDKLEYPEYYDGYAPAGRGFPHRVSPDSATSTNYGQFTRAASVEASLRAGDARFTIDLKRGCPLFDNNYVLPAGLTGGLELNIRFNEGAEALVGHKADTGNVAAFTNVYGYKITNLRFHCKMSYASPELTKKMAEVMNTTGIAIPYESYVAATHTPSSEIETIRLSSNIQHLNAVFMAHVFKTDRAKIAKYSHSNFGNPKLQQVQLTSGGVILPNTPVDIISETNDSTTGDCYELLKQASKLCGIKYDEKRRQDLNDVALVTTPNGDINGTFAEVKEWNGQHIVAIPCSTGTDKYSSIINRGTQDAPSKRADLTINLKYKSGSNPQDNLCYFFMCHSNVMRIKAGTIVPEQLTF